jgi:hypothetical protein
VSEVLRLCAGADLDKRPTEDQVKITTNDGFQFKILILELLWHKRYLNGLPLLPDWLHGHSVEATVAPLVVVSWKSTGIMAKLVVLSTWELVDVLVGVLPGVFPDVLLEVPPAVLLEVPPGMVLEALTGVLEVVVAPPVIDPDICVLTVEKVLDDTNGTRHCMVPLCGDTNASAFSLPPWIDAFMQVEVLSPAHSLYFY